MKNLLMGMLFLLFIYSVMGVKVNGKELSEKTIQTKAEQYYEKFKFEWDYILSDESKKNIRESYIKGSEYNRGYAAAISDFLESRGGIDRYMVNVNYEEITNENGKVVRKDMSLDCGRYGINTDTFAHYNDMGTLTLEKSIDVCYMLKHDDNLAFEHFNKTMSIAEARYRNRGYNSKEFFRKVMNYYNTGRDVFIGEHYIKSVALVKLFREKL